jgi:hypothetical protein
VADRAPAAFRTGADAAEELRAACAAHPDVATWEVLGESEEGRPLGAVVLGRGPRAASLIAGCHADEPVGPETLRTLVPAVLARRAEFADLLDAWRFAIVPHVNPDGEARNRRWIDRWPDPAAYLASVAREPPGRDLEFGFPDLRVENRLVAGFLRAHAPFDLHMSLHGMGAAEGALLLIERHWIDRTASLRETFAEAVRAEGLGPHDHDRKGEKGFRYIGPGFTTTPEGAAMRAHFEALGEPGTAALFKDSSMEFVRGLGGDPLCLVTELPLFVVRNDAPEPGVPGAYLALRERMALGEPASRLVADFGLRPLPPRTAMRLQLEALAAGLQCVGNG